MGRPKTYNEPIERLSVVIPSSLMDTVRKVDQSKTRAIIKIIKHYHDTKNTI